MRFIAYRKHTFLCVVKDTQFMLSKFAYFIDKHSAKAKQVEERDDLTVLSFCEMFRGRTPTNKLIYIYAFHLHAHTAPLPISCAVLRASLPDMLSS